jgi:hypothetical protein
MIYRPTVPALKGMSDDYNRLLRDRQQPHGPSFPSPPDTRGGLAALNVTSVVLTLLG